MNYAVIKSATLYDILTNENNPLYAKYHNGGYLDVFSSAADDVDVKHPDLDISLYNWVNSYHPNTEKIRINKYQNCEKGNVTGWKVEGLQNRSRNGAYTIPVPWSDKIYLRAP